MGGGEIRQPLSDFLYTANYWPPLRGRHIIDVFVVYKACAQAEPPATTRTEHGAV